ncbi:hypothetical protein GQ457_05G021960 [Hibiscus cannabinus]
MHGRSESTLKKHNWALIDHIRDSSPLPWVLGGDFNEILSLSEKQGGLQKPHHQMTDFRECLLRNDLADCKPSRGWFTWMQYGPRPPPFGNGLTALWLVKIGSPAFPGFRPGRSLAPTRTTISSFLIPWQTLPPVCPLPAALTAAQREGRLPGVRASKHGPPVNHLLFADDCLVFLRNDMLEVHFLKDILSTYSAVSGQIVNFSKSTAYFSPRTPSDYRVSVHEALGVQEVSDPGIYLGVPLLIGKNKYAAFGRYRDKLDARVSKWSNLLLSFSGREVLIKSIAEALPQYVMSCYLLPCSLVEETSHIAQIGDTLSEIFFRKSDL